MERGPVHSGCGGIEMVRVGVISLMAAGLVACGPSEDDVSFDGQFYKASIDTERGSREKFIVSARPVSASLEGAKEAARYEAIVYCVNRYGSSNIQWVVGPDSPDEELTIEKDTLRLQGVCPT